MPIYQPKYLLEVCECDESSDVGIMLCEGAVEGADVGEEFVLLEVVADLGDKAVELVV